MAHEDIRRRGFKDRTRLSEARRSLQDRTHRHGRTESVPLEAAPGRVTGAAITADRNVPHYDRAAMDGYAVRAEDTFGASRQAPVQLTLGDAVGPQTAVRVHTGSEVPPNADAVIMIEDVERREERLDVFDAVGNGENVGDAGEDVPAGMHLYEPGERLRPSDLGLLKSVGRSSVEVAARTRVGVIPTGDELVQADPEPGEIIETNGLTVSQLVDQWGGESTYHDVVPDDTSALQDAIEDALDHDIVVTTGGSSVGERDLVPEIVSQLGEVFVHGVALKPGHPVALGSIEETPVIMLPGYPVACIVNAVQFLRPCVAWRTGSEPQSLPTKVAELDGKLRSEAGHRTFARVSVAETDDGTRATPVRASGAGVLSSVTSADGWVDVPEAREGFAEGTTVSVQYWEGVV